MAARRYIPFSAEIAEDLLYGQFIEYPQPPKTDRMLLALAAKDAAIWTVINATFYTVLFIVVPEAIAIWSDNPFFFLYPSVMSALMTFAFWLLALHAIQWIVRRMNNRKEPQDTVRIYKTAITRGRTDQYRFMRWHEIKKVYILRWNANRIHRIVFTGTSGTKLYLFHTQNHDELLDAIQALVPRTCKIRERNLGYGKRILLRDFLTTMVISICLTALVTWVVFTYFRV